METKPVPSEAHPAGEPEIFSAALRTQAALMIGTFSGPVNMEWNPPAALMPPGMRRVLSEDAARRALLDAAPP
jgi:hypothetical protein